MDSDLLKQIPIFKGLSPADFQKLGSIIEVKSFVAGHKLFKTGDASTAFYIIKSGAVRIVREEAGKEIDLATLREGDFFGEMGVIEGSPRSASAIIAEAAALLEVEAHEFHRFMAINPTISMKIMSTMSKRYKVKAHDGGEAGAPAREPGKVITLFSATGGVGRSFVTANLAAGLKVLTRKSVAVVDLDLMFGDQTGIFDVKGGNSLSAIVGESEIGMDTLKSIVESTRSGVDLIPAPPKAVEAESISPALIKVVLEVLRSTYDFIVIDTARNIAELNLSLLETLDRAIYLLSPEVLSVKNARRWFSILDMVNLATEQVELVVNKEGPGDNEIRDQISKTLNRKLLGALPLDYKATKRSLNKGSILVLDEPESPLALALMSLARGVSGLTDTQAAATAETKGFWARLTSSFSAKG